MSATADNAAGPGITIGGRIRIGLRLFGLLLVLAACIPLYLACGPFIRHNPAPRVFMRGVSWVIGLRLRTAGSPPDPGAFLVANHVSWMDIPALTALTGTAFVAHDGLAQIGWLRWLCSLNDTVFIARHDRASVLRQVDQVREAIRDTGALTIFPEGTTADGVNLLPFKSSLLSALTPVPEGIKVYPVWLDFGPDASEIAWTGTESGKHNFLRMAARKEPVQLTVHFLEPLKDDELLSRKAICAATESAIRQASETALRSV